MAVGASQIILIPSQVVSDEGFISHLEHVTSTASKNAIRSLEDSRASIIKLPRGSFLLPTFCDLHLHAPQFLYQGNGLHLPLLQWLDEYAFKAEEKLDSDPQLARKVYQRLSERLIQNGTGTVLLFGECFGPVDHGYVVECTCRHNQDGDQVRWHSFFSLLKLSHLWQFDTRTDHARVGYSGFRGQSVDGYLFSTDIR